MKHRQERRGVLAVIPARKGSTGVPNKNLLSIGGQTCFEHTLGHIRQSKRIDEVVVITDDPAFKSAASAGGIRVIDEPPELCGGDVPTYQVIKYATRYCLDTWDADPECVIEVNACVPLRPPDLLDRMIVAFFEHRPQAVCGVFPVGHFHPMYIRQMRPDGRLVDPFGVAVTVRQQAEEYYVVSSAGYVYDTAELLVKEQRQISDVVGVFHGALEVVDLDTPEDVVFAEILIRKASESLSESP